MSRPRRRWSLRREAPVLLPVVLALFALLSVATLLLYRGALDRLEAEARSRTGTLAERLAADGAPRSDAELQAIARRLPPGASIAVLDADRRVRRLVSGVDASFASALQRPFAGSTGTLGPLESGRPSILAWARLEADGGWIVLESPEHALAAERRASRRWTPVVLAIASAAALVATLWVLALLRPYDELVTKARAAGGGDPEAGEDELEFVLATFDRALETLGAPGGEGDRAEVRERIAEGLAQIGQLSAGVAHELRNGLAAILGWAELARRRIGDGDGASDLAEIEREGRQLARVVDEFLAFARPGSRALVDCDLLPILRRVARDPSLAGRPLELHAAPVAAPLRGDEDLLERAIRNLAANAVRAQADAGVDEPVRLELERRGGEWEVRVLDRGAGLPEAIRERAFEPFVSGRPDGVGLGLALARRVALLHGGSLALEPRPGGGTAAIVRLPIGATDTESIESAAESRPGPDG